MKSQYTSQFMKSTLAMAVAVAMAAPAAFAQDPVGEDPVGRPSGDSVANVQSDNFLFLQEQADINYENTADVHLIKKSKVRKWVDLYGEVHIDGDIDVNAAALAIVDDKQIILNNEVSNDHVYNDAILGSTLDAEGNVVEAPLNFNGNTQVNTAAGDVNTQANDLAIAVANQDFDQVFGSADAEVFVFQNGQANYAVNNDINNTASVANVTGNGNLHINATAGNFNMQKNAIAVAVSSGRMAEANVYDKQELIENHTANSGVHEVSIKTIEDPFDQGDEPITKKSENWKPVQNTANLANLSTTGNTGINVSAGTNLLQANKVSISHVTATGFDGR